MMSAKQAQQGGQLGYSGSQERMAAAGNTTTIITDGTIDGGRLNSCSRP